MMWIRVEATGGLRIMAPSFSAPPRVEGIDKLFEYPIHARAFHCFCSRSMAANDVEGQKEVGIGSMHFTEEVLVLVQRKQVGGKLGDLTIAVGSTTASRDELDVLIQSAFQAIMRTNNSGARLILDALCASSLSCADAAMEDVIEYDGLPMQSKTLQNGEKRIVGWRQADDVPPSSMRCGNLRRAAFERRKALLYFVTQDVVPVSLLYCGVSKGKTGRCKSSVADVASQDRKCLQSLATSATRACTCLTTVIDRTLKAAFNVEDGVCRQLWDGNSDRLPFVAAFSTSGLLCASSSFFRITDHRDRFFVAALALDHLCSWPPSSSSSSSSSSSPLPKQQQQQTSAQTSLLHTRELLLKCGKEGVMVKLAFVSVGSAVACVFGFLAAGEGVWWDATTLLQFVENHVATPRVVMTFNDASTDDDAEEREHIDSTEAAKEFAPHLSVCTAPIYPTPWFHRLLHEINRIEEETPRDVLMGLNGTQNTDIPPVYENSCDCLPLFSRHGGKAAAAAAGMAPFIWYRDVADLPLDMAWCVASSRVVMAEANVCRSGLELGHHSLFLMKCSTPQEDTDAWRYGVGWFQHYWRSPMCSGNGKCRKDRFNSNCLFCNSKSQEDPTKLLQGLSSIGGGPRPSVHFEAREGSCGFFFQRRPKVEVRGHDDAPVFAAQTSVIPHSLLFDDGEVFDTTNTTLINETGETRWMTAFYVVCYQRVKGGACGALLQEMLLLEGDQVERERDINALMLLQQHQKGQRSSLGSETFAACHQAACCVLDEVVNTTRSP